LAECLFYCRDNNREPPLRPLVLSKHVLSSDWFEDEVVVIDIKEIVRQVGNKLNQELDRGRVECWENALVVISPGGQELVVGVESNRNVRAIFGGRGPWRSEMMMWMLWIQGIFLQQEKRPKLKLLSRTETPTQDPLNSSQ
jgi:hypothetical protein